MTPREHLVYVQDYLKRWQADYDKAKSEANAPAMAYASDNIARITNWIAEIKAHIRRTESEAK
jgi:hypothetical protein